MITYFYSGCIRDRPNLLGLLLWRFDGFRITIRKNNY